MSMKMKPREVARYAALTLLVTAGGAVFTAWIYICAWLVYYLMKWLPT